MYCVPARAGYGAGGRLYQCGRPDRPRPVAGHRRSPSALASTPTASRPEFAAENVRTIQLFQPERQPVLVYSGRSDVSAITPDRAREIANEYRSVGIDIHSIGVYTNLIHPDPPSVPPTSTISRP